jgi:hypothetical protein
MKMMSKRKPERKSAEGGNVLDWMNLAIYGVIAIVVLSIIWKIAKKLFKFALAIAVIAAIYAISTGII